jgi:hypothetical protein
MAGPGAAATLATSARPDPDAGPVQGRPENGANQASGDL